MKQHGLTNKRFLFEWSRSYNVFGYVDESKILSMSSPLVQINSEPVVNHILLHEVAHALQFIEEGILHGHNRVWKKYCRQLGIEPLIYTDNIPGIKVIAPNYYLNCPNCNNHLDYFYRIPKSNTRYCKKCQTDVNGKTIVNNSNKPRLVRRIYQ